MPGNMSKQAQILDRRQEVWRLRVEEGLPQTKIAQALGISQTTVSRDLEAMTRHIIGRLEKEVQHEKAFQLSALRAAYRESIEAWNKSKQSRTKVREARKRIGKVIGRLPNGEPLFEVDNDGNPVMIDLEVVRTTEVIASYGNPAFLAQALKALGDLRQLLGINAPLEINWKQELEKAGLGDEEASKIFEEMVQKAHELLSQRDNEFNEDGNDT